MVSETEFLRDLGVELADLALDEARRASGSRAISQSLEADVTVLPGNDLSVVVSTPFYWAVYYHDGRGAFRAKPGSFLVFFKDPSDDPRIGRGARNYPERETDVRRLSKTQFLELLKAGKIVVTARVGPAGPNPFFTTGMRRFAVKAGRLIKQRFSQFIRGTLAEEKLLRIRL